MNKLIGLLIISLLNFSNGKPISDLKKNNVPTLEDVKTLNHFDKSYEVYLNNENEVEYRYLDYKRVKGSELPFNIHNINPKRDFHGRQVNIRVDDGWIVGFDFGEFTGNLFWFNEKGTIHKKLYEGNISDIFVINDKIFIIEGGVIGIEFGTILELHKIESNWTINEICEFNTHPYCTFINDKNNFIFVTTKGLIEINHDNDFKYLIKHKKSWWTLLYPNSITAKDNYIYIGMRAGVLKLNSNDFNEQEWLTEK